MRCIVIDTETSSLSPSTGQIIECAAVIIAIDPVQATLSIEAEFSSLVHSRLEIDEKITRITGITPEHLAPAPGYLDVQETWANWLEKNQATELPVIGHSIGFDIHFLQEEGWMVPTGKAVDTLDTCKLLLPHIHAINLEHLMNTFELSKKFSDVNLDGTQLQPHRALYDSKATAWLVRELVEIAHSSQLSPATATYLSDIFLPDFQVFPHQIALPKLTKSVNEKAEFQVDVLGNIRGQTLPAGVARGLQAHGITLLKSLEKDLRIHHANGDSKAAGMLAKLLVFINKMGSAAFPKIHMHGSKEYNLLTSIMQRFETPTKIDENQAKTTIPHILNQPEQYISRIGFLAEKNLDVGEIIKWLELTEKISILDTAAAQQVQKTITQCDFFLFGMQNWWRYGQFLYTPQQLTVQQYPIREKFQNVLDELHQTHTVFAEMKPTAQWSQLQIDCVQQVQRRLDTMVQMELSGDKKYILRQRGNGYIISEEKTDFSLQTEFDERISTDKISGIETYLSTQNLEVLWKLINVKASDFTDIRTHQESSMVHQDEHTCATLFPELEATVQQQQKHVLVFAGQSSTLKMLQTEIKKQVTTTPTFVIGEDGGATKLLSKIQASPPAIIVIRSSDVSTFTKKLTADNTAKIWLLNEPYVRLHRHWKNAAEKTSNPDHFVRNLKNIHTAALCGKIQSRTKLQVHFVESFEN